jgi:protoporphyrinogen oxidase
MRIHIVGAGFSGLTLAYYLNKALKKSKNPKVSRYSIHIFEKNQNPGGLLGRGFKTENGVFESAANGVLNSVEFVELCDDLGVTLLKSSKESQKKYIYHKSKPRRFPFGALSLFEMLFCLLCEILKEFSKLSKSFLLNRSSNFSQKRVFGAPYSFETVLNWGQRVLGKRVTQDVVSPALQGIFATTAENLSASFVFKTLSGSRERRKRIHKSLRARAFGYQTVSPEGGMPELVAKLYEHLRSQDTVFFHFGQKLEGENLSEWNNDETATVLCLDLKATLDFIGQATHKHPGLKNIFEQKTRSSPLTMLDLSTATIKFKPSSQKQRSPFLSQGFGILFPKFDDPKSPLNVLGVLFNSIVFPTRNSAMSETYIFRTQKSFKAFSENPLAFVLDFRKKFNKNEDQVLESHIFDWPQSLPQYDKHLCSWEEDGLWELFEKELGLYIHGNFRATLSLSKLLLTSKNLATRLNLDLSLKNFLSDSKSIKITQEKEISHHESIREL